MTELQTWINVLGPAGALLFLGLTALRGAWPWIRDQYLAKQVEALGKIVSVVDRMDQRQVAMENAIAQLTTLTADLRTDQAAMFAALDMEQPTRPRGRQRAAAAGAK